MVAKKEYSSYFIYTAAILLLVGEGIDVTLSFNEFIRAGEGIGVYGVLIYYAAALFSVILWGVSYFLFQSKKLALVYWALFLIITIFIATQPTWWAAP
jgi:hypothetical protein